MTHLSSIAISLYFYWRHNAYCEPGIYSGKVKHAIKSKKSDNFIWRKSTTILVFSLCEYVVIMSNLGYHATSYYDYHHVSINLSSLL